MNIKKLLFFALLSILSTTLHSQASSGKSTVYFTRANSLGALINFTYFDGDKAIGKFKGMGYFIYECEPGEHLFWARSENKSFVEAILEPGKTYLIDVQPRMGGLKASVKLVPVDKNDHKMKPIQRLVTKREPVVFSEEELAEIQEDMTDVIDRGMENYDKKMEKEKDISQLTAEMTITEADLVFEKKRKK